MKIIRRKLPLFIICSLLLSSSCGNNERSNNIDSPVSVSLQDINMKGELQERLLKNFDRLEEMKYQPQHVFLTEEESGSWPGDTEGRTILGLVLNAKATKRTPKYLTEIIEKLPAHLNSKGYMGLVYDDCFSEQQLSGNGWLLRGLCEYYDWTGNEKVLSMIKTVVDSLFVPIEGHYKNYPISEEGRRANEGDMSGTTQNVVNKWLVSSDIGCVFIGMDGLIHAYKYYPAPKAKMVIEEMIARFLEMDPLKIKAQTHATLTGMRGLMRYDAIRKSNEYTADVERLWNLYKQYGMTETYANYNWFKRYDTWTEPCAIVDSYIVAVQLWQSTQNAAYLEDAEQIYYNALAHAQRDNGGFGCDNCPGKAEGECLRVFDYEAHWCCTMRGAEGLASAAEYSVFHSTNQIYFTSYRSCDVTVNPGSSKSVSIKQETCYPFENKASFTILESTMPDKVTLSFFKPAYMTDCQLYYNGQLVNAKEENGFISIMQNLNTDDTFTLKYKLKSNVRPPLNNENSSANQRILQYGPLIMGYQCDAPVKINTMAEVIESENNKYTIKGESIELSPVYHLMNPAVNKTPEYQKRVIFDIINN